MTRSTTPVKFRQSGAFTVGAGLGFLGAVPLIGAAPYLAPVLVIPLLIVAWAWRAGTDIGPDGIRARALLGSRHLPWSEVAELAVDPRGRVLARLTSGTAVRLVAVPGDALPRLLAAGGQHLTAGPHLTGDQQLAGGDETPPPVRPGDQ